MVGKFALHDAKGVLTTSLQPERSVERTKFSGSKSIENIPERFVVAVETTFPPHCNCTKASAPMMNIQVSETFHNVVSSERLKLSKIEIYKTKLD